MWNNRCSRCRLRKSQSISEAKLTTFINQIPLRPTSFFTLTSVRMFNIIPVYSHCSDTILSNNTKLPSHTVIKLFKLILSNVCFVSWRAINEAIFGSLIQQPNEENILQDTKVVWYPIDHPTVPTRVFSCLISSWLRHIHYWYTWSSSCGREIIWYVFNHLLVMKLVQII